MKELMKDWTEACGREEFSLFLKALTFSAEKHRHQRRKDKAASPYINHPIEVAGILWTIGKVSDMITLVGAILHDTIEDTDTSPEEIRAQFGEKVLGLVLEMSDDKSLPKPERKQNQISHSPHLSRRAQEIKLADKISNVRDIAYAPPGEWSMERRVEYLRWAEAVIDGLRGANKKLEQTFDETLALARKKLTEESGDH